MLSFAADENFNIHIVNGVLRRLPTADIARVQDAGLEESDDSVVLEWAAAEGRVLLTHDVNTLAAIAYERIARGLPMPGVFEVSLKVSISDAIEDILLLAECSLEGEWEAKSTICRSNDFVAHQSLYWPHVRTVKQPSTRTPSEYGQAFL